MCLRFKGLCYRAHNPAWSFNPVSGDGAKRHGGRFNPIGVPALYTSLSELVALAEYQQGFLHRPQPTILCSYEIDCIDIVDLTDLEEQNIRGISPADLACSWEYDLIQGGTPVSWAIAQSLIDEGIAGIIVPSFASNSPEEGKNLVFWIWNDTPSHRVDVIDDLGRLPGDQESWR
jgi:RES domain-containing protein